MLTRKFMNKTIILITNIACALALAAGIQRAAAQGTAFIYQGQLQNGGSPANGLYDFQFALSNAPSGGAPVGSTVTELAVAVTNGLFTTTLDFGAVFAGNPTWLAISVRTNGAGNYIGLTPLQQLTPTPYAIFATSASEVLGTIPLAQLPASVVTNNASNPSFGNLTLNNNLTLAGTSGAAVISAFETGNPVFEIDGNANLYAGEFAGGLNQGLSNVGLGYGALNQTTGQYNSAVGVNALGGTNVGSYNTAVGSWAMQATWNEVGAVAIGYLALCNDNAAGDNAPTLSGNGENTAVGFEALGSDNTGAGNSALGYEAMLYNYIGNFNTAIGDGAMKITTGSNNTAVGQGALSTNFGSQNVVLGSQALMANRYGSQNVAVGYGAMQLTKHDSGAVAVGYQALYNGAASSPTSTLSGNGENTAVGYQALLSNTTGVANTALGYEALSTNTFGYANTAIGDWAMSSSTNGADNTAIGAYSLMLLNSGSYNIAIGPADRGAGAGENLISGSGNIYIGSLGPGFLSSEENDTIRIGEQGNQTTTTIAGIYGGTLPGNATVSAVQIDSNGHLAAASGNSFAPTIGDGTHNFTTSTQTGYYEQVGNWVNFEIWLKWSGKGSAVTGDSVEISLPLPVVSQRISVPLGFVSGITYSSQLTCGANGSNSYLLLYELVSGGTSGNVTVANCASTGEIQLSGSYRWQ
jgi:hypothetical protein